MANQLIQTLVPLARLLATPEGKQITKELLNPIEKWDLASSYRVQTQLNSASEKASERVEKTIRTASQQCKANIDSPKMRIEVDRYKLSSASKGTLISAKAIFTPPESLPKEVDCVVSCGHWHKLGELKSGPTVNILDHLDKLLPPHLPNQYSPRPTLGLVTFQNGINHNFDRDFQDMAETIVEQFPEGPLCIGLYNPTSGFVGTDLVRLFDESKFNPTSVNCLCQFIFTLADLITTINPQMIWAHFAHSEASLLANTVLGFCMQDWYSNQNLQKKVRACIKNNLVAATYGAVMPIADEYASSVLNSYTEYDVVFKLADKYLDIPSHAIKTKPYTSEKRVDGCTYKVTVVDSKLSENKKATLDAFRDEAALIERLTNASDEEAGLYFKIIKTAACCSSEITDHGFLENTYRKVFKDNIDSFRKAYQIYEVKTYR